MNVRIPIDLIESLCAFFCALVGFYGYLMIELNWFNFQQTCIHSVVVFSFRSEKLKTSNWKTYSKYKLIEWNENRIKEKLAYRIFVCVQIISIRAHIWTNISFEFHFGYFIMHTKFQNTGYLFIEIHTLFISIKFGRFFIKFVHFSSTPMLTFTLFVRIHSSSFCLWVSF